MFEEVFSTVSSFFQSLDFLGIPFLFWVIALVIFVVVLILAFVVFRPKKVSVYSAQESQNSTSDYSSNNSVVSQNASQIQPDSSSQINQSISNGGSSSNSNSILVSGTEPISSSQILTDSNNIDLQFSSVNASSDSVNQKELIVSKSDGSLKAMLITKFQSKIEGQLGDKVLINDVSSQNENFLVAIDISGVEMILTLDPAGKIIDYKKTLPQAK
ncbi:MAG: hypothetical protein WCI04_01865 [archaeon]